MLVHQPLKNFYKKFLYHPFPVESSLHEHIHDHMNAEIATGTLKNMSDGVEYLTWTFLFRRLLKNPSYYQLDNVDPSTINEFLRNTVQQTLVELHESGCVKFDEDDPAAFEPTHMGKIASYYYLQYETMGVFHESLVKDASLNDLLRFVKRQFPTKCSFFVFEIKSSLFNKRI